MKIIKDGVILVTNNEFVIEQLLKHGGVEVKDEPKKETKKTTTK